MNRIALWLGAAAFSAGGLVAAVFAVDALTSDAGISVVPSLAIDGSPLVASSSDPLLAVLGDTPPESLGEIPIDVGSGDGGSAGSGAFVPVDDTSGGADEGSGATGGSDGAGAVYPWDVEGTGFAPEPPQPYAGAGFSSRFVDACSGGTAGCPFGVGGTVLAPGAAPGDYHIYGMTSVPDNLWDCRPVVVGEGAFPVLVVANQPSRMEIRYHPVGQEALSQTVVVDLTDPAGPAARDFQAAVARGETPPTAGVHHCWVLHAQAGDSQYQVKVEGTGLEGDLDTFSGVVEVGGTRPPVWISSRSDWELVVGVPVTSAPEQRSVVHVLYRSEGLSCSDIEATTLADASSVVSAPSFGGYQYREDIAEVIGTYDPAYDAYEYWSVSLQEGYGYLLCVWWVSTPGSDSFNSNFIGVDEREQRRIVAPDRYRPQVVTLWFTARRLIAGRPYIVESPSFCKEYPDWFHMPDEDVWERGQSRTMLYSVCSLRGLEQPASVFLKIYHRNPAFREPEPIRMWIPTPATPRCRSASSDPGPWCTGTWTLSRDSYIVKFGVHYDPGEDVTNEVTLSGFADCNTGGVISIHEPGADRGTPSGGCFSWLIGNPSPF
jgi:hypothetical protein